MSSFVFSLALCVVFILSLYVCYSCYYNNFVSILTIGCQLDEHALAFLVACHFVLNLYYVITVYSVYGEINMMMMMMMMMMAAVVLMSFFVLYSVFLLYVNPIIATLEAQSSGPLYNNTVIGTLAVGGWAVTFGTAWPPCPVPSSLYQM